MIDKFGDIRNLHILEQCGGDIYAFAEQKAEENDEFWGTDLNEEKMEKLNQMRELCIRLTKYSRDIRHNYLTFDNTNYNGSVQISLPSFYFCDDKRITRILSALYGASDHAFFSGMSDDNRILLTFCVEDMWNTHGTIADKNRKK